MSEAVAHVPVMTADDVPLKVKLSRATRRSRIRAFLLVVPLLAFILATFLLPIGDMLFRSVENKRLIEIFPQTIPLLEQWDGQGLPDETVFATFAEELTLRRKDKTVGRAAARLNYEKAGMRSLITMTARKISGVKQGPFKEAFLKIDERWGERETWATIKLYSTPYTLGYYLAAMDMRYDADGDIVMRPEEQRIYIQMFVKTLWISLLVTVFCLVLGYPVAYLLATLPVSRSNLLMILVLLPFWTSLLVRTTTWIVLLQSNGVINDILVWVGIIADENRIRMIYNQTGTLIAMTQILLPFMILPLYSVMKTISPASSRAAQSLGANPFTAFRRIYLPQTIPGVGAGSLLVFILSIGYYITPALVGGASGQMISNFIAFHMKKSLNWGLAAALGAILLAGVLILYWLYDRFVGIDKMKLG
ncbi:MAG: ABC transporter permease [Planctomycetes bacterium]|nr:ABC transporter permease [Planctomycetota bacterium]